MNSCPGSGRLGLSLIFHCPSDIGSQGSFLYLGMDGKLSLMIFRVKFLGCFVVGGPQVQMRCPSNYPLLVPLLPFLLLLTSSLISCLLCVCLQLRRALSLRIGTRRVSRLLLNTQRQQTILIILSTLGVRDLEKKSVPQKRDSSTFQGTFFFG